MTLLQGIRLRGAAATCAVLISTQLAIACLSPESETRKFVGAEVVIRAKVQRYEVLQYLEVSAEEALRLKQRGVTPEPRRPLLAIMEFETIKTIAGGPHRQIWRAYFVRPRADTWTGPADVIVALEAKIDRDGTPRIVVRSSLCSPTFLPDEPENVARVLSAIADDPSGPYLHKQ